MCCFSGHVERVSGTKIFARPMDGGRQAGLADGTPDWSRGFASARAVMDEALGAGLVDADGPLFHRELHGRLPNHDVWA